MKTKNKPTSRTAKRTAKKTPVAFRKAAVPAEPIVFSETTETHVRFFNPGETEPFSVIHNGPEGSQAAADAALALTNLKAQGIAVQPRA